MSRLRRLLLSLVTALIAVATNASASESLACPYKMVRQFQIGYLNCDDQHFGESLAVAGNKILVGGYWDWGDCGPAPYGVRVFDPDHATPLYELPHADTVIGMGSIAAVNVAHAYED